MAVDGAGTGLDAAEVGTGLDAAGTAAGTGRAAAGLGLEVIFEGAPPGPPFRKSFPVVIGLTMALPFGVGRETEFGDSPGPT